MKPFAAKPQNPRTPYSVCGFATSYGNKDLRPPRKTPKVPTGEGRKHGPLLGRAEPLPTVRSPSPPYGDLGA
jgi:hypothetical protein